MTYDTTSPGAAGVRYPASMDQHITTSAAQLAALTTATEIRAWFAATDHRELGELTDDPWAAAFGRLQTDVRALLGIIDRQREEIASLRDRAEAAETVSDALADAMARSDA